MFLYLSEPLRHLWQKTQGHWEERRDSFLSRCWKRIHELGKLVFQRSQAYGISLKSTWKILFIITHFLIQAWWGQGNHSYKSLYYVFKRNGRKIKGKKTGKEHKEIEFTRLDCSYKMKHSLSLWFSNHTPWYLPEVVTLYPNNSLHVDVYSALLYLSKLGNIQDDFQWMNG